MGLQSQLNDVSSDSIPLLLVALIANCVAHLRSLFLTLFHSFGVLSPAASNSSVDDGLVGSGLAGLIVLAEQLNLNRVFSYRYCGGGEGRSVCVVCYRKMRDGDQVRKLDCRHVFHKVCFDGWIGSMRFDCPICRSSVVSEERVECTRRRVGGELVEWFPLR